MEELKPCPFCGRKPKYWVSVCKTKRYVDCENNQCFVQPGTLRDYPTKTLAVKAWNHRAKEKR